MKEYDLNILLDDPGLLDRKIKEFTDNKILKKEEQSENEVKGHIQKAEHNLRFVNDSSKYPDWSITGCYYACYHAALSLIKTKGFSSKNHLATLLILIKEFYDKGLDKDDINTISTLLDYQDILFYVESKNKREDATYSTNLLFDKKEIEQLRIKAVLFVNKIKDMLDDR